MKFNCCICNKRIWFFQRGMRLTQSQEKKITGIDRPTIIYMEGKFAHENCYFKQDIKRSQDE